MFPVLADDVPDETVTLPPDPEFILLPAFSVIEPPIAFPELPPVMLIPPLPEVDSSVSPVVSAIVPLLAADWPEARTMEPDLPAPETVEDLISTRPLDAVALLPEFNTIFPPVLVCEFPATAEILPPSN